MGVVGGMNRAIFRALIPSWLRQGYSPTAIIRHASSLGYGVRKQWGLAQIREYQGFFRHEKAVTDWPSDRIPHRGLMTEVELKYPRKYRVFADADHFNWETGQSEKRVVSFYTDELSPYDNWESRYIEQKEEAEYRVFETVVSLKVRGIEHNKGWRY